MTDLSAVPPVLAFDLSVPKLWHTKYQVSNWIRPPRSGFAGWHGDVQHR